MNKTFIQRSGSLSSVTCSRSVVFSGTPVSSIKKTYLHNITEILLKVALNTIQTPPPFSVTMIFFNKADYELHKSFLSQFIIMEYHDR